MKKLALILILFISIITLTSCDNENAVLQETKEYKIESNINSLDIQINTAEFMIEFGEEFLVESNLKNLSISEKDETLFIVDDAKNLIHYTDAMLRLYIPRDITFNNVIINSGAAKLTSCQLSAKSIELKFGSGLVQFAGLNALNKIDIEGGAAEIIIEDGTLNNFSLDMGVGELELKASLIGKSDLNFGVGSSNITLIGGKDNYTLEIKKAIGSVNIDGKSISNSEKIGTGPNYINIESGVGSVDILFQ